MPSITLIFPHQLFKKHPAVTPGCTVYLIEEALYFNQYAFHKKKLVLHRASMKYYAEYLAQQGCTVNYIEATSPLSDITKLIAGGFGGEETILHYADVTDDWLQQRIAKAAAKKGFAIKQYGTPYFLNPASAVSFFDDSKKQLQTDFYIEQRKARRILLEKDGKPIGSRWTYDTDNRLRFPTGHAAPAFALPTGNAYVTEAIAYVAKNYPENPGNLEPPFFKKSGFYPVTHAEAEAWLTQFLLSRLAQFGPYEDAMVAGEGLLYHSALSMLLNSGLLTPQQVLDATIETASETEIPLASLEGFIRQIMGWREYVHLTYQRYGVAQRTTNYWGFTRKIPPSFYNGTTGIEPVDTVIKRVLQNGYCHHIERLMVLANFMLLCEFHPNEVYRWFMEMFVDAYDWVMVPNTYGMTQVADGGRMMTKPYISGSNYLMKMGNWSKGPWQAVWDGLFWRFMKKQEAFFRQNQRLGMLLTHYDRMPADKQAAHLSVAENFLSTLDSYDAVATPASTLF